EGGSLLAGESVGVDGFLEGAGPWVADAVNVTEGGAVLQSTAGSCVAACGEMLSGGAMSQAEFLAQLGEWSNPGALAEALNALEGVTTWEGGYFASAADAVVAAQEGQMGAVLQAPFLPAHMVVLEPGEAGMFLVRDPAIGGTDEGAVERISKHVAGGGWGRAHDFTRLKQLGRESLRGRFDVREGRASAGCGLASVRMGVLR